MKARQSIRDLGVSAEGAPPLDEQAEQQHGGQYNQGFAGKSDFRRDSLKQGRHFGSCKEQCYDAGRPRNALGDEAKNAGGEAYIQRSEIRPELPEANPKIRLVFAVSRTILRSRRKE